ncbi:SnoaL-like domain-containing protein [Nocardioides alpinus]|uniref:Nuclear transport factor 2 family protein n=1 Tax=Nocardioides alpinus TaxID=748909 RepID=A0A1I0ZF62_9ACTN|nr:nuclear transport factor 2 family protein [Nocardioides alpinus]PKH40655.1 nuclear transport factor 2 family protein [Nocardioides alpinus]SFB23776.1 SnoaL-like domain-containing protein [Nocardioides alpinus]
MTTHTAFRDIRADDLPATIRAFLAAHAAREPDAAVRTFTRDAVVVDQDETFRGTEQVLDFLRHAGSEFTYTTELVAARRDDTQWVAVNRIEGDFPGNVADLTYRFTLTDDLISALTIR